MSDDDNVHILDVITTHDIPVQRVLDAADAADLDSAVVIGWGKDGDIYFSSSMASGAEVIYIMALAHKMLLDIGSGEGEGDR